MVKRIFLGFILCLCCCWPVSAEENGFSEKEAMLIKITEAENSFEMMKNNYLDESRKLSVFFKDQVLKEMPNFDEKYLAKIDDAGKEFLAVAEMSFSSQEVLNVWRKAYFNNLSEEDIDILLAFYVTETNQKAMESQKNASKALQDYFVSMKEGLKKAETIYKNKVIEIIDDYTQRKYSYMLGQLDIDQETLINKKTAKIFAEYGVYINTGYEETIIDQPESLLKFRKELLSGEDTIEFLGIAEEFLSMYPRRLLEENIIQIYPLKSFNVVENKDTAAISVAEEKLIYVKGNRSYFGTLDSLHHEFAHILRKKYGNPFMDDKFFNEKTEELKKNNYRINDSLNEYNEELCKEGYLTTKSLKNLEEDFSVFAANYWVYPIRLEEVANKYPLIKKKFEAVDSFYKNIFKQYQ